MGETLSRGVDICLTMIDIVYEVCRYTPIPIFDDMFILSTNNDTKLGTVPREIVQIELVLVFELRGVGVVGPFRGF